MCVMHAGKNNDNRKKKKSEYTEWKRNRESLYAKWNLESM